MKNTCRIVMTRYEYGENRYGLTLCGVKYAAGDDIGKDRISVSAASESRVLISVKTEIADDMDNLVDALNDFRAGTLECIEQ